MALRIFSTLLVGLVGTATFWVARSRRPDHQRRRWLAVGIVAVVIGLPIAALYGKWTYATVRCGRQPVAISNFAASYTYWRPGDQGYSRRDLFLSYVCSESDARAKGYRRSGVG